MDMSDRCDTDPIYCSQSLENLHNVSQTGDTAQKVGLEKLKLLKEKSLNAKQSREDPEPETKLQSPEQTSYTSSVGVVSFIDDTTDLTLPGTITDPTTPSTRQDVLTELSKNDARSHPSSEHSDSGDTEYSSASSVPPVTRTAYIRLW